MVEVPASVRQGGEPGLAQAALGTVDLVSWLHPTHLLGEEEALVPVGAVGRLAVGVPVTPVSEGSSTGELIRPEEQPSYYAIIDQMAANPTCFSGSPGRT